MLRFAVLFWHQNGFKKGSKMASWRLPGGLWGARGAQVPKNLIFNRILGPLEGPFWLQKSSKHRLKFELQSSIAFDQHFGPSGGLLGRFWESFLDDFGMVFGSIWCPNSSPKIQNLIDFWIDSRNDFGSIWGVKLWACCRHF